MQAVRVLDVGNCDPDHRALRALLSEHFEVTVDRVMFVSEALAALRNAVYGLVLVNRRIFADDSDGLPLITAMQSDPELARTPIMMISNYADAQAGAVAAGAVSGFGKATIHAPATIRLLAEYLPRKGAHAVAGAQE
jgi:CheY-like chemotaxis protein